MEMVKSLTENKIKGNDNLQNNGDGIIINNSVVNLGLFEKELSKSLIFDLLQIFNDSTIDSNGSFSLIDPADLFVKLEINDASKHKVYALNYSDDFNKFDYIIVMDEDNYRIITGMAQSKSDVAKVIRMSDYFNQHSNNSVPDPYYGDSADFELALDLIEDGCDGLLKKFSL